jgi:hypothetical protein
MSNTADTPIIENPHVKEFLSILRDEGRDAKDFLSLLSHVTSMENQLTKAVEELTSMRRELAGMREERDHPVRPALEKASRSLEAKITETRTRLAEIKEKIIEGCKAAVAGFKEKGAAALNGIAKFFRIKPMYENLRKNLQSDIRRDQAVIAKIEAMGTKYHTAGMHLRNVGRTLRGKEAVAAVKPNGKLAKLAAAPFRAEMRCLQKALNDAEKAIAALDRLDKSVVQQKTAAAERKAERPSTLETMKRLQKQLDEERADAPVAAKTKKREAEL